jgi:hypothetical protein
LSIIKSVDFLFRRMEGCRTMIEKEKILELLFEEAEKIKSDAQNKRNLESLENLKHLRKIFVEIKSKYS